jgi:hypothetical protein
MTVFIGRMKLEDESGHNVVKRRREELLMS